MSLDSVIGLRRIKELELATLAAVLDVNSNVNISVPGRKAMEKVSLEFSDGTLREALDKLGLLYKEAE
jgi:hypothetical protein